MAHAYTPGLKVSAYTLVKKERKLPLKGKVLVTVGEKVNSHTIIAKTELPGKVVPINLAGLLGVPPEDIEHYLVKEENSPVEKDEIIAQTKGIFGLFRTTIKSPIDGVFESYSKVTGQGILRERPSPVEICAYIDGEVVEVLPEEGAVIEAWGMFLQGIFGIGGEANGELIKVVERPEEVVTKEKITPKLEGKILIGGSLVTKDAILRAIECKCKGIVVGGIGDKDLKEFLGYELGVAITGRERKGITLIITEGFGKMKMSEKTFELLSENEGKKASINGATQIRAGVMRPEVIVIKEKKKEEKDYKLREKGVEVGDKIRIIREPYFGKIGKVIGLPPELEEIQTGAKVRVFEVELEEGKVVRLPRANVEIIEE
jgi:transcription antitermination factor NusG